MTSDAFRRLDTLARNLWWTWNPRAQQLFAALDPALWRATNHNPLRTIKLLTPERRDAIAQDESFARQLDACEAELRRYLVTRPWFDRAARGHDRDLLVAYFCAEFAVHESLPQYSGGLGVLAGDHLKSASDLGVPLVGVGLLYRGGFYRQSFRADGSTGVTYPQLDFEELPVTDTGKKIAVPMG